METSRGIRQRLLAEAVLAKIRREGLRIDSDEVRTRLEVTWCHVSGPILHGCVARWQAIVEANDVASAVVVMSGEGEDANEMRSVSPLGVLLTESERREVIRRAIDVERLSGP